MYFREMDWDGIRTVDCCCEHGNEHFGVYVTFRTTQTCRFYKVIFVQLCYMFRLSVSAIIRWECWFTKEQTAFW